jgi:flagellar hook-length control protein FliK
MTSNQAASSANMTGNLFQIFNLPKSGNSSYLFSDIIKVIGIESEGGETVNSLASSFFADSSKSLIDSNKLISLLKANITSGNIPAEAGEDLSGKYYITETELTEFINKMGLDGSAEAAKLSPEIAVEVTPAFLNKLSALINSNKAQAPKNIFATIAPEEEPEEIKLSDGEESEEAEGSEKIQVIFKKVPQESDIIAAPQQFAFNNEQDTPAGTAGTQSEGEFLFGGQAKNIILGGSKYEFFADASSGKTHGAQVLSGGDTAASKSAEVSAGAGQNSTSANAFAEIFAEMNTSAATNAETKEAVNIAETGKSFKSDGLFFTEEAVDETPVIKAPAGLKINVSTQADAATKQAGSKEVKVIFPEEAPVDSHPKGDESAVKISPEVNKTFKTEFAVKTETEKAVSESSVKTETEKASPEFSVKTETEKAAPGSSVKTTAETAVETGQKTDAASDGSEKKILFRASNNKPGAVIEPDVQDKKPDTAAVNKDTKTEVTVTKLPEIDSEISAAAVKEGTKNTSKISDDTVKTGSTKIKENNEPVKESTAPVYQSFTGEEEAEPETTSSFHFNSRVSRELMKKNYTGLKHNEFNRVKADNSNIYEITFGKSRPENNYYEEKVLPQDFDTSDYETLNSGIFSSKAGDSFKEHRIVEKTDTAEKNPFKVNEEVKQNSGTGEQPADTGSNNNSGNETTHKPAFKAGNEITFADHLQGKTANVTETTGAKPVKGYTSVLKEINAANLIDEVKNLCIRGEKSNITLKLSPEHLGTVKLSIDIKDSVMSTSIEVENESVKQVVQNNMESLRQTLQQNGIQLSSFSVSLSGQHEQKSPGKPGNKRGKQQETGEIKVNSEEKTVKTKKLGYNTYEYLA